MGTRTRDDLTVAAVPARSATFLFADIAGFTALTEAHGDEEAAVLVFEFTNAVKAELPAFGGTHVKCVREPVDLFAAVRARPREGKLAVDPVCQMAVEVGRPFARLVIEEAGKANLRNEEGSQRIDDLSPTHP